MVKPLVIVFMVFSMKAPALAMGWRGSPEPQQTAVFDQPYEAGREKSFKGSVFRVDPDPCVALPTSSYHLLVQINGEMVEVHLGPCWYVSGQKMVFREGDKISVVGSESVRQLGSRHIISAREIRRGKEVLKLRDGTGKGLWQK